MDDPNNTADTLDQTAEELLTHAVSDEALEAAAGTERGQAYTIPLTHCQEPWGCSPGEPPSGTRN
jgi:hypothetical protein